MYTELRVSAIAAVGTNGVIGDGGALPWHLPGDLRYFKRVTRGHAVIMGRKTWDTLPKPLPKRLNIVVSRHLAPVDDPRVRVVRSAEAALAAAADWERITADRPGPDAPEIMVVGGGGIYELLWPWVDRFYRTLVHASPPGDARFAEALMTGFARVSRERVAAMDTAPAHDFEVWERA